MQKFASKYATAAHLAITAVAPLFLYPFFGAGVATDSLLWLSLFAVVWVVMAPSVFHGERSSDARRRVAHDLVRDPFFWFGFALVTYAGIRALNGGVGPTYDPEASAWSLSSPTLAALPGSVTGKGGWPFAGAVALWVTGVGVRNALGKAARSAFMFVATLLSALLAMVDVLFPIPGLSASGVAFGIAFVCSTVAFGGVYDNGWKNCEFFALLAVSGNLIGLLRYGNLIEVLSFSVSFVAMTGLYLWRGRSELSRGARLRSGVIFVVALSMPLLFIAFAPEGAALRAMLFPEEGFRFFPEGYPLVRKTVDAICLRAWRTAAWLGTGLGSFDAVVRFNATEEDWSVLGAVCSGPTNGYLLLLLERGLVGALVFATGLGILLATYGMRLAGLAAARDLPQPMNLLAPLVLLPVLAAAAFGADALNVDAVLACAAALGISARSIKVRRE